MRPTFNAIRLPLVAIAIAVSAPVFANDTPAISFVPGTGSEDIAAYEAPTLLPAPAALAAPKKNARDAEADMIAMAETMEDPRMQDGVAGMVEKMGETMMRLPIGKFATAIEKARPGTVGRKIRDRDTIADLAGNDARGVPEMLGKQSRVAMKMMGGFAKAFASMMPEFEKMGREMEASMADLKVKHR